MPITQNIITLKPETDIDSATDFDSIINFDFNGGISAQGTYQIPSGHRIYNATGELSYVNVDIDSEAYNINPKIDLTADFDAISNIDSTNIGAKVSVTPYLRLSNDGATYGSWQVALSGTQYKAKYYDFKLELKTTDTNNITVIVKKFGYSVYR